MNQGPLAGMLPTRDSPIAGSDPSRPKSCDMISPAVREKAFERPFHGW